MKRVIKNIEEATYKSTSNVVKNFRAVCLHCGKESKEYCEKCYQELVAENTRLQVEADEYVSKEQLRIIINECSEFGAYVKIKDLLEE